METISKLSAVCHLNVCLWLATFTLGVARSECGNGGFGSDQVDQDVQNCTAPLCLPDSQCSLHSAFIQSPNYPKPYPAKQDAYWFLKLTKNTSVDAVVIRVEDFHLEKDHDWVNIGIRNHLDSSTVQESLTGILRRGKTVRVPFSFGFQVYVHFHSDNTIQLKGFRFRYTVVPKEPRRVQVVKLTPTTVLLRWDPLVTKAQRNVTYKVYHGPYGEQTTLAGARLVTGKAEYNLTGLMASTSYFAYVVALMSCGQEDIGCLVNFTTTSYSLGETLHPRVELSTIEVECDTVFVSWNSPKAAGSSVIGYRVRIVTDAGMQVKATQVRYVTLRNLRADQDYNITVTVVNTQGEGPPSNQLKIRLPKCRPGEAAPSLTPVLAQELRYRVRSSSLLIQLPSCTLLDRIAGQLRQNLSVWVLLAEGTAGVALPSEMVPGDWNATYWHTDIGRRGVHLVHRHLPCYPSTDKSDPLTDFGIFQVGGEETCSPTWTCNGPLRSNTTYRLCYVLVSDGSPILFSQWSEPFTTRTVVRYQDLGDGERSLSPAAVTASLLLTALCLLLLLGLLGVAYQRQRRTDGRSLVWRSFALRHLNPVQLSGLGTRREEVTADSTSPGSAGVSPQH